MADQAQGGGQIKWIALLVVLAAGIVVSLRGRPGGDNEKAELPAICTACGEASTTQVGPTPGSEDWPRECPKCHKRELYLGNRCGGCRKLIPMKDLNGTGYGNPDVCPWCKGSARGT